METKIKPEGTQWWINTKVNILRKIEGSVQTREKDSKGSGKSREQVKKMVEMLGEKPREGPIGAGTHAPCWGQNRVRLLGKTAWWFLKPWNVERARRFHSWHTRENGKLRPHKSLHVHVNSSPSAGTRNLPSLSRDFPALDVSCKQSVQYVALSARLLLLA